MDSLFQLAYSKVWLIYLLDFLFYTDLLVNIGTGKKMGLFSSNLLCPSLQNGFGKSTLVVAVISVDAYPFLPRDIEILSWCPAESVLPHGEKVPL